MNFISIHPCWAAQVNWLITSMPLLNRLTMLLQAAVKLFLFIMFFFIFDYINDGLMFYFEKNKNKTISFCMKSAVISLFCSGHYTINYTCMKQHFHILWQQNNALFTKMLPLGKLISSTLLVLSWLYFWQACKER